MFSSAEVTLESLVPAHHEPEPIPNAHQVCISGLYKSLRSPWSLRSHDLSEISDFKSALCIYLFETFKLFGWSFLQAEQFLYFSEEPHFRNEITTMRMFNII